MLPDEEPTRELIKKVVMTYESEIDSQGERRIRVTTKTAIHFPENSGSRHNPTTCTSVEYLQEVI